MSERVAGGTPVIGADETIVKVLGKAKLVGFVADAESGGLLCIDMLVECDSEGFADWLKGYAERLRLEAVATADLYTYKSVVDKLGLEHQVCVTHVRKNAARRLHKVKGWQGYKSRLRNLLDELPDDGASGCWIWSARLGKTLICGGWRWTYAFVTQSAVPQTHARGMRYEQFN